MTRRIRIDALDTLFFRDGGSTDAMQMHSSSKAVFPPSPSTVVGAFRALCARNLGWNGRSGFGSDWDSLCEEYLGSGDDLGPLSFQGPFVVRGKQTLFPVPSNVLSRFDLRRRKPHATDIEMLSPGPPVTCDLGTVRLAQTKQQNSAQDAGESELVKQRGMHGKWWITREGFAKLLSGLVGPSSDDCIPAADLWSDEQRVGLSKDRSTGDVTTHATKHLRLGRRVGLEIFVDGLDEKVTRGLDSHRLHSLGGEARCGWFCMDEGDPQIPDCPSIVPADKVVRYCVYLLSPLSARCVPEPGKSFLDFPGEVVCACLPPPQRWGGWSSLTKSPLPSETHLAPGGVIYMEASAENSDAVMRLHGTNIGPPEPARWGFGLIAIGNWPHEDDR